MPQSPHLRHGNNTETYGRPFFYVFDASALSDGLTYTNLQIDLQRDYPFTLHRIAGLPSVGTTAATTDVGNQGLLQVLTAGRQRLFSVPARITRDWPIVPALAYPEAGQIAFSLANVLRAYNTFTNFQSAYKSQLIFQGIKHVRGTPYRTPYSYYEKPHSYTQTIPITWANKVGPAYTTLEIPRQFTQVIESRDFELLYITLQIAFAAAPTVYAPSSGSVALELYDPMQFPLQSAPVLDDYINYLSTGYNNGFPNPPVVYPVNSIIRFAVTSLLTDVTAPASLQIGFHGINRMPMTESSANGF